MGFLDPPECQAARDCLARGQAIEAARILSKTKYPEHRAVRNLRVEIGQDLLCKAKEAFGAGQVQAAYEMLQWAAQCIQLEGEGLILQKEVEAQWRREEDRKARQAAEYRKAQHLIQDGRLNSGLDLLAGLADYEPAQVLRQTVERRLARYRWNVDAGWQAVKTGQPRAAHRCYLEARKILPTGAELPELASAIAQALASSAVDRAGSGALALAELPPEPGLPVRIQDKGQRFVLGNWALVVSTGEVCLGSGRADRVQVPLLARVHSRHAVLMRDRRGWQLTVCRDRHNQACKVWIDGRPVEATERLTDGQCIELGEKGCRWRFRQPISDSLTAVLEAVTGSSGLVCTGEGTSVGRVVLLADRLVLNAEEPARAEPAHMVLPELPCKSLVLEWKAGYLHYRAEGGRVRMELPGQTIDCAESCLYVPSQLVVESDLDEIELLAQAAEGGSSGNPMLLEVKNLPHSAV